MTDCFYAVDDSVFAVYHLAMPITGKKMLRLFLKSGWEEDRITGSHHIVKKGNKTVVIPVHAKDLAKGLEQKLKKILEEES